MVIAEGDAGPGLDVAAQQPPLWMFRCTAFGGVLGFVLVVVRLIIFDDVILATEQGNDTCDKKTMIISQQYLSIFRLGIFFIFTSVPANYTTFDNNWICSFCSLVSMSNVLHPFCTKNRSAPLCFANARFSILHVQPTFALLCMTD